VGGSGAAPWSFVVVGATVIYIILMSLVLTESPTLKNHDLSVAMAHAKRGQYALAVEDARRFAERRPDSPWGWTVSAGALLGLGRLEEALTEADRAVALGGTDYARIVRGSALFGLGLFEEAYTDFRATSPESLASSGTSYAYVLIGVRSLDDAVQFLTDPTWSSVGVTEHALLGEAYRLLGDPESAAEAFGEAIRLARMQAPTGDTPWLAYCLAMMGDRDEARALAEDVLTREEDISALRVIALLAALRKDRDEAHEALRRTVLAWPRAAVDSLTDPQFTPLMGEKRFRDLLAWAIGAQRQRRERVRERFPHLFG
ncbi:MAG TPA: tetratricopeptide repeat protein, partial [Dehalococcoidia bacterium]|nr:tetratricopeptide repeat protein [Dehalococcoidia bacterium]